jgi:hypothetical protein
MRLQRLKKTVTAGVAGSGMAAALMFGFGGGTAHADVLDDLAGEYHTSAGAGEVANLLNQTLQLRAAGFRPTNAQYAEIQHAMDYRPNQVPLIHALQDTVAGQRKLMSLANAAGNGQQPFTVGVNQYDPNNPGGVTAGPGGVNVGGGPVRIGGGQVLGPAPGG